VRLLAVRIGGDAVMPVALGVAHGCGWAKQVSSAPADAMQPCSHAAMQPCSHAAMHSRMLLLLPLFPWLVQGVAFPRGFNNTHLLADYNKALVDLQVGCWAAAAAHSVIGGL